MYSSFDAANRISSAGFSYDDAGRLLSDGTTTHTWDRAERLLTTDDTVNTHTYAYNGLGQRLSQDVNGTLTSYLLDVQPGLYNVLASTTDPDTTRFVKHGNRSLRQQQPSGQWQHLLTDGLGSVRSVLDANHLPLETVHYSPYGAGNPTESLHGFTGEPTDVNGLVHLRARYYDPALGVFPSLDPVENGNRYAYVQGNPINAVDPSGLIGEDPNQYQQCGDIQAQITCPDGTTTVGTGGNRSCVFTYRGWRAALQAIAMTALVRVNRREWNYNLPDIYDISLGTSSMRFISLALAAGGFPLTQDPSDKFNAWKGWKVRLNANSGKWVFSKAAEVHDRFIDYLTGNVYNHTQPVAIPTINAFHPGLERATIKATEVFTNFNSFSTAPSLPTVPSPASITDMQTSLADIEIGDYVIGKFDPMAGISDDGSHGFLVVAKSAPVPCDNTSLEIPDIDKTKGPSLNSTSSSGVVPYVADIYGIQRGSPRPFYCAFLNDGANGAPSGQGNDGFFSDNDRGILSRMTFYKIPRRIEVPIENVFGTGIYSGPYPSIS